MVAATQRLTPTAEADMLVAANGWWLGSIIFIIIWVAIAFWPARVAARKGHSFFLYFLFSLVFFPLALLVAYLVRDRTR
jgi:hypothetical protein